MNALSTESKAKLYDDSTRRREEMDRQEFSTFVEREGKLIPVPVKSCFKNPYLGEMPDVRYVAYVNGGIHEITAEYKGHYTNWFSGGDDGTSVTEFTLVADGVVVGYASHEEY